MEFAFTDDQRFFQQAIAELLQGECPPEAVRASWDNAKGRVEGLWAQLASHGLLGMTLPEAVGGLGLTEVDRILLLEELGRYAVPEPVLGTAVVASHLLDCVAPEPDRAAMLGAIAQGETVVAVGLDSSEWVADAGGADLLLLLHEGCLHRVSPSAVSMTAQPCVDGSERWFAVTWTPTPQTVLAEGVGEAVAEATQLGALGASAQLLGVAQRMLDMAVEYAGMRRQFGRPIGAFQAVKHRLADAAVRLAFARPLVYRAAWSVAASDPMASVHVSMAKAAASTACDEVGRAALQVHGAIGYTTEYDLHLWLKRGWVLSQTWGDAAWHRARVADAIL